ncbi:MAG: TRAP transporter fused permease subunit [Deltaproteobacteria bacterium]|nr:TRAP transporter fused permease subunit [Deltaproteobacteria bacterium]
MSTDNASTEKQIDSVQIAKKLEVQVTRLVNLPMWQTIIFFILSLIGTLLGISYIFGFSFRGQVMLQVQYYWLFIGLFSACVFIAMPARQKDRVKLPWYDLLIAAVVLGICIFFALKAHDMQMAGWKNIPMAIVIWLAMMEAARRGGGLSYLIVVLVLGLYPLVADKLPGILYGIPYNFTSVMDTGVFRDEGMMGITTKIVAEIILGFLVFAGVLLASGAGDFFISLANALLGGVRGGPAKVSVIASAFFGSLSGSVFSNIVGTGAITIPTMKRVGYPPHYAGAIEACSSTGGTIMPPVMGAIAFVMAVTISVDYSVIMIAAVTPSVLYYFGLLMQVDAYAAKVGMKGLPKEELPTVRSVLAKGWPFLTVMIFLVWGLLYMRWEYKAPWYAALLMVILSFWNRETWMTPKRLYATFRQIGELITQTAAVILPIAFVVSALTITGITGSLTSSLVKLGGGNIWMVLLLGIIACYVMGMAGLSIVAYIFLSVTLAPAIIKLGNLNMLAVHLFIVYYAMLAGITPPVAAGAFLGGTIAGAPPMKTALTAMRLGIVIYFVPLFFVFQPAMVLQGNLLPLLYILPTCILGIALIAAGCEGYLIWVGKVQNWARIPLIIAGFLLSFPTMRMTIIGLAASAVMFIVVWLNNRKTAVPA